MVLLEEEEEEIRSMVEKLPEYLKRKSLELNTSKTKVMRFRKGGGGGGWIEGYGDGEKK